MPGRIDRRKGDEVCKAAERKERDEKDEQQGMVIMPQMVAASDAQKGITRRLHVLNADATKVYTVTCKHGQWACSCPAWKFHSPRHDCKHIDAVKMGPTLMLFPAGSGQMKTAARWAVSA
jgi:hypothetical protein